EIIDHHEKQTNKHEDNLATNEPVSADKTDSEQHKINEIADQIFQSSPANKDHNVVLDDTALTITDNLQSAAAKTTLSPTTSVPLKAADVLDTQTPDLFEDARTTATTLKPSVDGESALQAAIKAANAIEVNDASLGDIAQLMDEINPKIQLVLLQATCDSTHDMALEATHIKDKATDALTHKLDAASEFLHGTTQENLKQDVTVVMKALTDNIDSTTSVLEKANVAFEALDKQYKNQGMLNWTYPQGYQEAKAAVEDANATLQKAQLLHDQIDVLAKTVDVWNQACPAFDAMATHLPVEQALHHEMPQVMPAVELQTPAIEH
ncbi:MAG: hypothetical protein AB7V32_09135, partial [Candidatus Berkiella sp.]